MAWIPDPEQYRRRPTREVRVGEVCIGGRHPIVVQSMTTPATSETAATVAQIGRLVAAGCEIVRVTVPTTADADNLPNIRRELRAKGIHVPLVADIHFTPAAAMKAVEHVEKIRVNPGNFADRKRFAVREYSDTEYLVEIERLERVFRPLVLRCKELGVAMRIGTNHGSLSDRILNRYGDTPEGMVESALEFVRICEAHGYRELVLSMKASNPVVVLQAYRLLVTRMDEEGRDYPLHLGVTEAGDGEDGRTKSAVGIGALLDEGLGDTVRVSLTEDPVLEIPVARALVAPYNELIRLRADRVFAASSDRIEMRSTRDGSRRGTVAVRVGPREIGGLAPVVVEVPIRSGLADLDAIRREIDGHVGPRVPDETRAEIVSVRLSSAEEIPALGRLRGSLELLAPGVGLSVLVEQDLVEGLGEPHLAELAASAHRLHVRIVRPLGEARLRSILETLATTRSALLGEIDPPAGGLAAALRAAEELAAAAGSAGRGRLLVATGPSVGFSPLHATRAIASHLDGLASTIPIVLVARPFRTGDDPVLSFSATLGGLLCEGIGDAIHVDLPGHDGRHLAYNILQAARVRMTRTEFISCPSCGRTLFDLEDTTARIKSRTRHLKGLKIAVMGCVVNGPGEMADADFGYVGWGEEKIALFVGKEMVAKDIPTGEAADRLVDLIKRHGRWREPSEPDPGPS